ncbi:unnamed protein product [Urochloa humidicola]
MAELNDAPRFALGISYIIKPLLDFLRGGAVDAAVAVLLVALTFAYLTSIVLLQLRLAPPAPARRFACLACTMVAALLVVLAVPLIAFWLLIGGSPPRGAL